MSRTISKSIFNVMLGLMLVAIGFYAGTSLFDNQASADSGVRFIEEPVAQMQRVSLDEVELTDQERTMAEVYQSVSSSVVAISITRSAPSFTGETGGSGSGFVIDRQGYIMTNYHVVEGANDIVVNFLDGTIVRADVVGLDPDSDLAVIEVDLPEERLFPVTFGTVDELVIGQSVVAIGSPFGQRWTLTSGIISALDRTIQGLGSYSIGSAIQTDAPINPGNSGGPLLNLRGEVIGVNSQIISQTRSNSGIGFAVPSDLVQRVAQELINNGEVAYSYLGISGTDVNLEVIESLDLANNQTGVVVSRVESDGPAGKAGLQNISIMGEGPRQRISGADIITAIDETSINSMATLIAYLAKYTRPGDTVGLRVLRDGEIVELPVTLSARP